MFANIVYEQRSHCASVVCRCNGSVPFLPSGIPDLGLDGLGVNLNGSSRKFDADGRFGVKIEFIPRKPAQQVRLPDAAVSN